MPTIEEVQQSIGRIRAALQNCNENERPRLMAELLFHQQQLLILMELERARIERQNYNMEKFLDILRRRNNWMCHSFKSLLINFTFYILLFSCYNFKRRLCVWVSNSGTEILGTYTMTHLQVHFLPRNFPLYLNLNLNASY